MASKPISSAALSVKVNKSKPEMQPHKAVRKASKVKVKVKPKPKEMSPLKRAVLEIKNAEKSGNLERMARSWDAFYRIKPLEEILKGKKLMRIKWNGETIKFPPIRVVKKSKPKPKVKTKVKKIKVAAKKKAA